MLKTLAISLSYLLVVAAIATLAARAQSAPPVIERFKGHEIPAIPATDRTGHPASEPDLIARLGALGLPYSLIIGRDGHETGRVPWGIEWDKGETQALIARSIASR